MQLRYGRQVLRLMMQPRALCHWYKEIYKSFTLHKRLLLLYLLPIALNSPLQQRNDAILTINLHDTVFRRGRLSIFSASW